MEIEIARNMKKFTSCLDYLALLNLLLLAKFDKLSDIC